MLIHHTIRARRLELGLSQVRTAELSGLTQAMLSLFERGKHTPNWRSLEALMNTLGLEVVVRPRTAETVVTR